MIGLCIGGVYASRVFMWADQQRTFHAAVILLSDELCHVKPGTICRVCVFFYGLIASWGKCRIYYDVTRCDLTGTTTVTFGVAVRVRFLFFCLAVGLGCRSFRAAAPFPCCLARH